MRRNRSEPYRRFVTIELAMHNPSRYLRVMEAVAQLKTARNLAKCLPEVSSDLALAADSICMTLVDDRKYFGGALPTVEDGFDAYMAQTGLANAVYPAGEFTEFGVKLFNMFAAAWAAAMEVWS